MELLRRLPSLALVGTLLGCGSITTETSDLAPARGIEPAPPGIPNERDADVLEAVLLGVLQDPELNLTRTTSGDATIVLEARVAPKIGFISATQLSADVGRRRPLSDEILAALLHRNQKPGTFETLPASFAALQFDPRIVALELGDVSQRRSVTAFEQAFPHASAWAEAWLPAYTADGSHALVRLFIGPTSHGATVTAWLSKSGDGWRVEWQEVCYYC